jgi:hypothetical protein
LRNLQAAAKRLLDEPVVAEAFATEERLYAEAWARSEPRDAAGRELLHAAQRALRMLRVRLQALADAHTLDQHRISQQPDVAG